jgi:peptidyl-prolyl cis-trans isomerase SurA
MRGARLSVAMTCLMLTVVHQAWADEAEHIVAVVNGRAVTSSELAQEITYRQIGNPAFRFPPTRQEKRVVLERLIDRILLLQEAEAQQISGAKEAIEGKADDFLRDLQQEYPSRDAFEQELESLGIEIGQLRDSLQTLESERARISELVARQVAVVSEQEVEAYEAELRRAKQPVVSYHLAHILFRCTPNDSEKEIEATEQRAVGVLIELQQGASFETVAQKISEDGSTKNFGGDLGYLDGGRFDPLIEKAIAGLKIGELSSPVRNAAGVHIFKLLDKRTARDFLYARRFAETQEMLINKLRKKADIQIFEQFL